MEPTLSMNELAEALSIDVRMISLLVRRERLPAARTNGRLRFSRQAVETWDRRRRERDLVSLED
jgi:excisionase family DNA binding protein